MLFNSYPFLVLLAVTLTLYYLPKFRGMQLLLLIIASFVFYAWHTPLLLLLLLLSGTINAVCSYLTVYGSSRKRRRAAAILGVVANLLILISFKYNGMLGEVLRPVLENEKEWIDWFVLLPLPIGISFYTFQGISLIVDLFRQSRGDGESWYIDIPRSFMRHYRDTLFFISFFPQLIAGPIVKAHDFLPQIGTKYLRDVDWKYSFRILVLGYFLKMVVADNLQNQTFWLSFYDIQSTLTLLVIMFGYSIQIFADFAGYSLIAIGVASLFGYRLPQNFDYPYLSRSFFEFWKRWHMTLGLWLKEYLYIPLGGNRKGRLHTYLNLMIVMTLGGLWHGASITFLFWGAYHGILLISERFFSRFIILPDYRPIRLFQTIAVFSFVTFGWLFFQLDIEGIEGLIQAVVHNIHTDHNRGVLLMVFFYTLPVLIYYAVHAAGRKSSTFKRKIDHLSPYIYGLMLFAIIFQSGDSNAFIYFQF